MHMKKVIFGGALIIGGMVGFAGSILAGGLISLRLHNGARGILGCLVWPDLILTAAFAIVAAVGVFLCIQGLKEE